MTPELERAISVASNASVSWSGFLTNHDVSERRLLKCQRPFSRGHALSGLLQETDGIQLRRTVPVNDLLLDNLQSGRSRVARKQFP